MHESQIQEGNRVATGHFCIASHKGIIHTTPLGSCVALVAFDSTAKVGGIAHIMLPGESQNGDNKYAKNAISSLLNALSKEGASLSNLCICLVGGANVLRKTNDNIASALTAYIINELEEIKLTITRSSLGGFERRSATLDIATGTVYYTIGNSPEKQLHCFKTKKHKEATL